MDLVVAKFGGTSVKDFDAMENCVKLVMRNPSCRLVVTSAPSGVTDLLVQLSKGGLPAFQRQQVFRQIRDRLTAILTRLVDTNGEIRNQLYRLIVAMEAVAKKPGTATSLALQDELLSYGERFASLLLSQCFVQNGVTAFDFDVRQVMLTDASHQAAIPNTAALGLLCQGDLSKKLTEGVVVTQGFVGITEQGKTTTLGRGGSDYSAALLSEALGAKRCEIWTDVAGVYSTDPRIVPEAFPLPELSYDEAAEMANFGAKVLHPDTLLPTLRNDIPVFVGATANPGAGGTTIVKDCLEEPFYRAITRRRDQELISLHTPKRLRTSQFIGSVFSLLDKHNLTVDLITTSETSIALTFNASADVNLALAGKAALAEIKNLCTVEVSKGLDLVTVVGNKLHENNGVTSKIFALLSQFNVRLICYGANPHNLSFLVPSGQSKPVIQALHSGLFDTPIVSP